MRRIGKPKGESLAAKGEIGAVTVRRAPGAADGASHRALVALGRGGPVFPAAIGRSGVSSLKREGDGATPRAAMRLVGGYLRRERTGAMPSRLALRPIRAADGWCDAPGHPSYNRPVRLPFAASHERLQRLDRLYDVCLVMDWNLRSRRRNAGSAIFFHIASTGFGPTEGCIAVTPAAMRRILRAVGPRTVVRVP